MTIMRREWHKIPKIGSPEADEIFTTKRPMTPFRLAPPPLCFCSHDGFPATGAAFTFHVRTDIQEYRLLLWKEAGCGTTELDYTEQTSWIPFLKYLDDLEQERALKAGASTASSMAYIIDPPHRWSRWAAPKTKEGAFDHNKAMTGAGP